MKKATKTAGKTTAWMWKSDRGTLYAWTCGGSKAQCEATMARNLGRVLSPSDGKPVRVEIREAAKGKVKRGK